MRDQRDSQDDPAAHRALDASLNQVNPVEIDKLYISAGKKGREYVAHGNIEYADGDVLTSTPARATRRCHDGDSPLTEECQKTS